MTNPKIDEREVAADMITIDPRLDRPGPQTLIADKGYRSAPFEADLTEAGITLIRPAMKANDPARGNASSSRSARSSSRSTRPSRPNSTSNATAAAPPTGSGPLELSI